MAVEQSLTEQELNFISSGGTTPLDPPADAPTVSHEPDTEGDPVQPGTQDDAPAATEGTPEGEGEGSEPAPADNADRDRRVPYAALKEEREARKERDRQIAELNEKFARADERLQMLTQRIQPQPQQEQPKQEAPAIPNPDEDFVGALRWTQQQLIERQRQEQEWSTQQSQQAEQQRRQQEVESYVVNTYQSAAAEKRAQDPTFDHAYQYLMTQRYNELVASGASHEAASRQVQQDEFQMAAGAIQARQNPAERLVAVARARGWAPPAAQPATPPVQDRLETVARGQAANASLSAAGSSGTGKTKLTVESLASMPAKEFEKLLANDPEVVSRVMGG